MDKEAVWKYYGEVAKKFGESLVKEKDEEGNLVPQKDEEGNDVFKRENYSLQFFYENILNHLVSQMPLFSVFFGDENAIDAGSWNCDIPLEDEISQWFSADKEPYANQIEAIRYAVSRPLTLIQGPPGTGKTEMILNLLSVIHGKYPSKTVAVVSANNEAIKNITVKIEEDEAFSNIREVYAQWGNNGILYQWQKDHKEYKEYFYQKKRYRGGSVYRFDPQLLTKIPLFSCTIHSLRKIFVSEELFMQDRFESDTLFDYIIVDECSQVSTLLGLVALGSAKEHLVLIGDNEQLAPVVDEKKLAEIEKHYSLEDVPTEYRVTGENTFLKVCEEVFKDKAQNVLLNEHYRCHPAIIGFCNECVYENTLVVKTVNDGQFPIRVLWYEGEYSEYMYKKKEEDEKDKRTLRNMRQIEIFLREEWTLLRNRIEDDMDTSICVISPYRGQLDVLEKLLKNEIEQEKNREIKSLISGDLGIEDEKDGMEEKIPCLTIHKSQGKGFDIVCFLSVCDYDSFSNEPWAQQRRMINVAVSRAKRELHVVVCNHWLPEEFQKDEVGYVLPHPDPREKADYYLIRLIEYTYRNLQDRNLHDRDFGFHRSTITSLFDCVPLYRKSEEKTLSEQGSLAQTVSAPEKCMRDFLVKYFSGQYKIYREVPLSEIYPLDECNDSELKEYIENGSRIDFLICKDKKALLAIEVDGAQHRRGVERTVRYDELKNRCFELLENEMAYLRINTDGSGCWRGTYDKDGISILSKEREIQKMRDYLEKTEELSGGRKFTNEELNAVECVEADKDDLLSYYKNFLEKDCLRRFRDYMYDSEKKLQNDIPSLSYDGRGENDYSRQETDDFYFCKYGIAYAFEYAMLYEIMLRIHETEKFGVYSFGCGGYIDAWSLAYARARLQKEGIHKDLNLYYQGVDAVRWKTAVFGELIDDKWPENDLNDNSNNIELLEEPNISYGDTECKISKFKFRKPQWSGIQEFNLPRGSNTMLYNVLMFPKLLNELDLDVLDKFIKKIDHYDKNKQRDYYICVSHSPADLRKDAKGAKAVEQIVEMFKENGFECEDNLQKMFNDEEEYKNLCEKCKIEKKYDMKISAYKYYIVGGKKADDGQDKPSVYINKLDDKFECGVIRKELKDLSNQEESWRCQQMTNADIAFQIIKFTKVEKQE